MEKKLYCIFAFLTITFQMLSCVAKQPMSLATDQTALLSLKKHITSDPSRILATNWTNSSSVCNWIGVACSLRHRRVAALNLSNMALFGTIPPQLGHLSFLVSLDLTNNLFHGDLPQELSLLRRLKFISFRLNNFTGDIPPMFGQLPKLEYLNLRNNSFIGSIPKSLSNLTNLQFLDLSSNSLSGEIPKELGRLQSLQSLRFQFNHLFGAIPSAIFNISTLVAIALRNNELSGSLPTDMCRNLPFLAMILLSENRLSGTIPRNISQCSRLEYLSLAYNSFRGEIPSEIGYLTSLQGLYLGGNKLNGIIPHEIGNLQSLVEFGAEYNEIAGSVDFSIFTNMSSLQTLLLWRNKFAGNLSRDVGNFTMLTTLELSENYLTGLIPSEFGQLYQLETLLLQWNSLSGSIPQELFNISTLEILSLVGNALSGILPTHVCHGSPSLEELYLGGNYMSGAIPNSISNCSQLTSLALEENKFNGYIPTDLANLRHLKYLSLFSNNLTQSPSSSFITSLTNCRFLTDLLIADNPLYGVIPASVGNLSSSLQTFGAYKCKFSGNIPIEIGNLSNLVTLALQVNELSGNIPLTIKHLHELQGLSLSNNMLGGTIPHAICDLFSLNTFLNRGNQFSGPIPKCLGNVSSLRHLNLESNMLNSSIPSSLWGLKDLINLDLSSNSLNGSLPLEMSNLGAAIYINLSMNHLSGSIPSTIGKLQNLINLSLANNRLEGSIPVSVKSMISLVTLDLSYNNLSGSIPKSLEALQHLDYFNVSFNNLSGEIPNGGSFRNFTMDSFKGNEALCGIPKFHVQICSSISNHKSKRKKVERASFIIFGVVAFILVVSLAFIIVRNKRKDMTTREVDELIFIVPERISYYELMQATEEFDESNLLGTGSSCSVYKGILNNGKDIAVKVFNMQLEGISRIFDVECEILRSIRHRNLTSVICSCSNEDFKALVLEYMPKGNLEKWLYSHNYCLNLMERLNIMIDVASALEYLHHGYSMPIVHSDLKPSNVLLDEGMVAHVSDFGIAKLLCDGDSFVLTNTLATLGYIAPGEVTLNILIALHFQLINCVFLTTYIMIFVVPEYGLEGLLSTRCDVYSYGVMLIETFTRKRPSDDMFCGDMSLKRWVELSLLEIPNEVIDAHLVMNLEEEQIDKNMQCVSSILELALKCSADSPGDRINMKQAHAELQKIKRRFSQ
ncbi:probable LRR receptor-like serine/threonine-protein kinase At3g47570 isoform X1 [Salvia miltiorrhiza]|uniref:probable LRR receptor-like serine/threonine-protein kinase At3g47570 isoform X1 n=1 Tax=Salvia miltiorrhiza TaxID=226208 RepID=UPI0025AB8C50|nr:probable LRR receptor-like serine/threonine-protein kinase At3g47570 isoform X1 [Salvia miltiorrhiza]